MLSVFLLLLVNIILGLSLAFYGSRLVTWLFSIVLILIVGANLYDKYGYSTRNILIFLISVFLIFMAFKFFVKFGLFLVGLILGLGLGFILANYIPYDYREYSKIFILIFALVLGLLTAFSKNKILAFITALAGANIVVPSLGFLILNMGDISLLASPASYGKVKNTVRLFFNGDGLEDKIILGLIIVLTIIAYRFQVKKRVSKA